MDITSLSGAAVVVCMLLVLLRQQKPEMGTAALIGTVVVLLAITLDTLAPVLGSIANMIKDTGAAQFVEPVLRGLGVCIVTQVAADICSDAGQHTVAGFVELAGRLTILIIALPLLSDLLASAVRIING